MEQPVRIKAVGDIMLGDSPLMLGLGVRSRLTGTSDNRALAHVAPLLRDCDLAIGNLECVLSDHGRRDRDLISMQMRGSPGNARELRMAGFGVLSVANNHTMQHGPNAFKETVAVLRRTGIHVAGMADENGRTIPVMLKRKGLSLCILACSLHREKYHRPVLYAHGPVERLVEEVRIAANLADAVIVCIHWGDEFVFIPSPQQLQAGRLLVDNGAVLVLGHHPHVLQGVERIGRGAIAYSLGNLVFDFVRENLRQTAILDADISRLCLERLDMIPVRINDAFCPIPMTGAPAAVWHKRFDRICRRMDDFYRFPGGAIRYRLMVRLAEKVNQIHDRLLFLRQIPRYEHWVVQQNLSNFIRARLPRVGTDPLWPVRPKPMKSRISTLRRKG